MDKPVAYIEEVRPIATGRDVPRQVVTHVAPKEPSDDKLRQAGAISADLSRPVATDYIVRLEGENDFLRRQITVKDDQIKDLTERARETNHRSPANEAVVAGGVRTEVIRAPWRSRPQHPEYAIEDTPCFVIVRNDRDP